MAVGDGNITLVGAGTLATVNISGKEVQPVEPVNLLLITLTEGNDSYSNSLEDATIQALGGKDNISNTGVNVSIDGGAGNDYIRNNDGDSVTIDGGECNDTIYNSGDSVTIDSGEGNDDISNNGANVSIAGGAGNDDIYNSGSQVTIDGGSGDDTINSNGSYVTINGGTGNDSVNNWGHNSKINTGVGNDTIRFNLINHGSKNELIQYTKGDGFDIIYGLTADDTLSISGGSYSTQRSDNDVIVTVGDGAITLKNIIATADVLNINDEVISFAEDKFLTFTDANDSLEIGRDSITVETGTGNDSVNNWTHYSKINTGADDDYIYNYYSSFATINSGSGNDTVSNTACHYAVINTGEGNDEVSNLWVYSCKINTGKGNDSIFLNSSDDGNIIEYVSGDGNDLIHGFNNTSTLSIVGGTWTSQESGEDIIVKVGEGNITLVGAASLSSVNISGEEAQSVEPVNPLLITLTENADKYSNSLEGATILALSGDDSIFNNAQNVSINGGAGLDTIFKAIYSRSLTRVAPTYPSQREKVMTELISRTSYTAMRQFIPLLSRWIRAKATIIFTMPVASTYQSTRAQITTRL